MKIDQTRYNVILGVNLAIFFTATPLILILLFKRKSGLHPSAKILIIAFQILFTSKALADTIRALIGESVNIYVRNAIYHTTAFADVFQVFVIYYFVMNVGTLQEKFKAASP